MLFPFFSRCRGIFPTGRNQRTTRPSPVPNTSILSPPRVNTRLPSFLESSPIPIAKRGDIYLPYGIPAARTCISAHTTRSTNAIPQATPRSDGAHVSLEYVYKRGQWVCIFLLSEVIGPRRRAAHRPFNSSKRGLVAHEVVVGSVVAQKYALIG